MQSRYGLLVGLFSVLSGVALMAPPSTATKGTPHKVRVCHSAADKKFVRINIDQAAVCAHMENHGDCVVESSNYLSEDFCPGFSLPLCDDSCETIDPDPEPEPCVASCPTDELFCYGEGGFCAQVGPVVSCEQVVNECLTCLSCNGL